MVYPFDTNGQRASTMRLSHEKLGVDDKIEKDVLYLEIVNHNFRKVGRILLDNLDVIYFLLVSASFQDILNHIIYSG